MPVLFWGFALGNISGRGKKKLFLFLIVRYIYQSQLTMVCFDFALQISAGMVRRRSSEIETVKLGEKGWLKKETAEAGRQWGRQKDKETEINWDARHIEIKARENEKNMLRCVMWHIIMHPHHITCTHPSMWSLRCSVTYKIKATFLPLTQAWVSASFGPTPDSEKANLLCTLVVKQASIASP